MNIQVLPNWFKKVSLTLFLMTYILSNGDDFIDGFNTTRYIENKSADTETSHTFYNMTSGDNTIHWLKVISILSLITYMLSREKIEDDYISILRLESYQLSFLIITVAALFFYLLKVNTLYGVFDSVTLFIWLYLMIFFFKKRTV